MTKRLLQRWFAVLGMVTMLVTGIAVPLTTANAFAMSGNAAMSAKVAASNRAAKMPCHKASTPCPHCPQKFCPEMGGCFAKCFQSLPSPLAEARVDGEIVRDRVAPAQALVTAGSLIPPLLRPPSV